jgi:hypothetical protein
VVSGGIRIIEYEIVAWTDLDRMGDLSSLLSDVMKIGSYVGILRCTADNGRKVTFLGDAGATSQLVSSGAASNPTGVAIAKKDFPVMVEGWPYRLRVE